MFNWDVANSGLSTNNQAATDPIVRMLLNQKKTKINQKRKKFADDNEKTVKEKTLQTVKELNHVKKIYLEIPLNFIVKSAEELREIG